MSATMRDRYREDNVEFDLPVENICQELCEEIDCLRAEVERLRKALKLLVLDVQDYEAWQRPCYALDVARAALGEGEGEGKGGGE